MGTTCDLLLERGGLEMIKSQAKQQSKLELTEGESPLLDAVKTELAAYFSGSIRKFSVPSDLNGTPFEQSVWRELLSIPFGQTTTYNAIAASAQFGDGPALYGLQLGGIAGELLGSVTIGFIRVPIADLRRAR
jgi:O6-methylguanine-DNA--protein-cysteine methyltransferase